MKILLIHQFFLADGEAGGSRFNDMTRVWALAGHEITVIADSTHYQSGGATEKEDSTHPNIDVIRIRTANYKGHKKLARIRSYNQFAIRASKRIRKLERHDIVIASSPSLPVVIPAIYAKKKWKIPFVFEVRDLWPESAISTGVVAASSMIAKSGVALEKMAYNTADHIVALSPGIQRDIEQQVETRVSLIPNGVHPNSIRHQAHASAASIEARVDLRTKFGWKEDEYILVYLGAHGIANCLQVLIEAAAILQEKGKFKIV